MPAIVTFEIDPFRIVEIDTGGDNVLNWSEVYSEWKDWVLADPGPRLGLPPAFSQVGGQETSPTENLGITMFMLPPWKFRPSERDHKVTLVGNVRPEGGVGSVFAPTLGGFTVNTETQFTNLTDGVSQIPGAVWDELLTAHQQAGTLGLALLEIYRRLNLDPTRPLVSRKDYISAGAGIEIDVAEAPPGTFTGTRRP